MSAEAEQPDVDKFPRDRQVLARLSPEERAAIYLNSIRKMFILLLVVVAIGIIAAAILAVITIETINSVRQGSGVGPLF